MEEYLIIHIRIPGALILHTGILNTHSDHLLEVRNAPSASAQPHCQAALTTQVARFSQPDSTNFHSFVHSIQQIFIDPLCVRHCSKALGIEYEQETKILARMKLTF